MEQLVEEYQRLKTSAGSTRGFLISLYQHRDRTLGERQRLSVEIDLYGKVIAICLYLYEAHRLIGINRIEQARNRYNRACNAAISFFELEERLGRRIRLSRQCQIIHRDFGHLNLD